MNQTRWKAGITTDIVPAGKWWDAEDYHQKYLIKNPGGVVASECIMTVKGQKHKEQ